MIINKSFVATLVGFVAFAVIGMAISYWFIATPARGGFNTDQVTIFPLGNSATTSPTLLVRDVVTATTNSMVIQGFDSIDLNLQINATSSSGLILNWYNEFSDDGIDWFGEDAINVTSNIAAAHGSTTPIHTWEPGNVHFDNVDVTAENLLRKNISVSNLNSRLMRTVYSTSGGSSTSTMSLWIRATKRSD